MRRVNIFKSTPKNDAIICGVAARLSERFGWSCFWTRIISVFLIITNPIIGLIIYFALAWFLSRHEE